MPATTYFVLFITRTYLFMAALAAATHDYQSFNKNRTFFSNRPFAMMTSIKAVVALFALFAYVGISSAQR